MTALEYADRLLSPVTEEHEAEARIIISDLTALPIGRINIEAPPLSAALKERIEGVAKRRAEGEPLQYILGKWEFMGLPFYTRPCALIPRQDTETLCEEALKINGSGKRLLDLCCGTGCIGVSLGKLGGFEATFGDISPDCLALARENAALNGVPGSFILTDMFGGIDGSFDLICVNPPYIPTSELASLQDEVRREPALALDGGADGLDFYRRIARDHAAHLSPGGTLLMEVGAGQAAEVASMFPKAEIIKDLCGVERVVAVSAARRQDEKGPAGR